MTRRRAPKASQRERDDRRAIVSVLLARGMRGALTRTEGAVLAEHVLAEQATADETRESLTATTRALETTRQAADTAVREIEHDAERYKADYLGACQTITAMHEAATGRTGMGPIRGVVEDMADVRARMLAAANRRADDWQKCADRRHQGREEQFARAEAAEEQLAAVRALAARMRAGSPQGAAAVYAGRIEETLDHTCPDGEPCPAHDEPADDAPRCEHCHANPCAEWCQQGPDAERHGPKPTAEQWNARHLVGTAVHAYPGTRNGQRLITRTRSAAWTLGHGAAVVLVEGRPGGICLTHVDPIDPADTTDADGACALECPPIGDPRPCPCVPADAPQ